MEKSTLIKSYNTNLASEYFIMSILCRAGKDAYLSLGNKKGVDIIVKTERDTICIVEVKGVSKKLDWLINNNGIFPAADNLFYALVCYNNKIHELESTPDFWVIPSLRIKEDLKFKTASNKKTVYLSNSEIQKTYSKFKNRIDILDSFLKDKEFYAHHL